MLANSNEVLLLALDGYTRATAYRHERIADAAARSLVAICHLVEEPSNLALRDFWAAMRSITKWDDAARKHVLSEVTALIDRGLVHSQEVGDAH